MADDLAAYWEFSETDLAANRNGQLTEKQKTFLSGEHKTQKNVFLGVGGAVILLFICVPLLVLGTRLVLPAILSGDSSITDLLPAGLGVGVMISVIVIVLAVVAIYVLRAGKKADIEVKQARGIAAYSWGTKRVRTPGNRTRSYEDVRVLHLSMEDRRFEVKEELKQIIREGEEWKVYYTSYPFRFLSGEMVSK